MRVFIGANLGSTDGIRANRPNPCGCAHGRGGDSQPLHHPLSREIWATAAKSLALRW